MISLGKTLKVSIIFATVSLKVSALSLNPLSVTASIDNVSVQTPNGPILIQDIGEIAFELELIDKPIISSASLDVDGQNYSLSSDQKPNGFSLEYGYTDQSNPEQLYDLELSSENINWNSYTLGRTFNFSLTTSETPITYSHNLPPESAIPIAPNVSVEGNNVWESDSDGVTRMNINKNSSYLFTWDPFTDSDSLDYISVQLQEFTENQDIPITNEIILPPESTSHSLSVSLDHNKLYTYYVSFVNVTEQSSPSGFTHAIGTNDSEPFLETRATSITALDFKVSDAKLASSPLDGSVFYISSEDPVEETLIFENGTLTSIFDEINGQNIHRNEGLTYEYIQVNEDQFSIIMEGGEHYIFYENNGTGRLHDYSNNGKLDESGTWNFTFEQYFWEDYDDFSGSSLDISKWGTKYLGGGIEPYVSGGKLILSSNAGNSFATKVVKSGWEDIFQGDDGGQAWVYPRDSDIVGIEAEFLIPSSTSSMSGLQIGVASLYPLSYATAELNAEPNSASQYSQGFGFYHLANDGAEVENFGTTQRDTTHRLGATLIDGIIKLYVDGEIRYQNEAGTFNTDMFYINGFNDYQSMGLAFELTADNVRVLRRIGQEPTVTTILRDSNDLPVVIETNGKLQWNDTLDGVTLWGVWQDDDTNEWVIATTHYIDGKRKGAYGSHTTLPNQLDVDHPYSIDGDTIVVSEDSGFQYYQLLKVEDDIIYAVDGDEYPLYEQSFWFTSKSLAEQFHGDRSGEDWESFDDFSEWDEGYFAGGEPTEIIGSSLILSGNATAELEYPVNLPAELVAAADGDNTGNSFVFVNSEEQITGLEANILLPSTNEKGAGVYIAIWDSYPFESHAIELALKDDGNAKIVIDYLDEDGIEQEFVRDDNVSLDTNYSVRITHRLGKTSYFINNDEVVTSYNGATPDFWGFGAFGDENESYNAEISGIKILDKYPVEEYSKSIVETSDGNPVGLLSNENDFSWALDLNGTTLWSVSPDLSYQRFKYEFKGDHVTRATINQWDDNEIEEVLKLPYSISEDGVLFIEDAPHGDEYLNLIGIDENSIISAKYGSSKEESEYQEFTQFSYPIATEDNKAMTLQISENGEVADTFAIVDENNNTQMIFDSITDVIDFLKVQEDNATFTKWVELTNNPVIETLEYYAAENNTTDFFYIEEHHSIESYQSIAFDEVTQGPLSFKKFKGTIVDGITHYSRNGISKYFITPSSDIEPSSITLTTGSRSKDWDNNISQLATDYGYQLYAEGYSVEITQGTNDHNLEYISINGIHPNSDNSNTHSYYILLDLDHHNEDGENWSYAKLSDEHQPLSSSTYENALNIAMSLDFNDSWEQPKVSLDDFNQSSDSTSTTDEQEAEYDSGVSVPFAVTSYSETSEWYNSEWFGDFFQSSNGWIFHVDFGWLYPGSPNEPDSCWMYGEKFGWIWIDSYYFPLFYSDVKEGWIYFFKNPSTTPSTYFYDYSSEEWFIEKNLFEKDEIEEKNTQNQLDWLSSEIQKYW